jgi:hypothetical protein
MFVHELLFISRDAHYGWDYEWICYQLGLVKQNLDLKGLELSDRRWSLRYKHAAGNANVLVDISS